MSRFSYLSLFPCFLLFAHFFTFSNATTFEIRNECPYTVWAAAVPGGGRRLDPGQSWPIILCMFIFLLHRFFFLITFYYAKSIVQINKHFYLKVRTWLRISKNTILKKKIYNFFLILSPPLLHPQSFLKDTKYTRSLLGNTASCMFLKVFILKFFFNYFDILTLKINF